MTTALLFAKHHNVVRVLNYTTRLAFAATQLAPETNVGGYINTCLDLIANTIGAVLALVFARMRNSSIARLQQVSDYYCRLPRARMHGIGGKPASEQRQ